MALAELRLSADGEGERRKAVSKVTFVVEYEDGKEPAVHAGMQFEGGRVVAVSFSDYRDSYFTEKQAEIIEECLGCASGDDKAAISVKVSLQTQ